MIAKVVLKCDLPAHVEGRSSPKDTLLYSELTATDSTRDWASRTTQQALVGEIEDCIDEVVHRSCQPRAKVNQS